MRKTWEYLMIIVLAMGMFCRMMLISFAADDDIAGGVIDESYGRITWRIDKNGHLTVEGWGDFCAEAEKIPGYLYQEKIPWEQYLEKNSFGRD